MLRPWSNTVRAGRPVVTQSMRSVIGVAVAAFALGVTVVAAAAVSARPAAPSATASAAIGATSGVGGQTSVVASPVFGDKKVTPRAVVASASDTAATAAVPTRDGSCEQGLFDVTHLPPGWTVTRRFWDGPCQPDFRVLSAYYADEAFTEAAEVYVHPTEVSFGRLDAEVAGIPSAMTAIPNKDDAWVLAIPVNGFQRTITVFTSGVGRDRTLEVGEAVVAQVRSTATGADAAEMLPVSVSGLDRVDTSDGGASGQAFVVEVRRQDGETGRLVIGRGDIDSPGARLGRVMSQTVEVTAPDGRVTYVEGRSGWDDQAHVSWSPAPGLILDASGGALLEEPGLTGIKVTPGPGM